MSSAAATSSFIVLNETSANPTALPANITLLREHHGQYENEKGLTYLTLSTERAAQFLHLEAGQFNVTADQINTALTAAGTKLFELPFVWGDDKTLGRLFIDPAAITHLCACQPTQKAGETEPHVAFLFSLRGGATGESYAVPLRTFQKFITAVQAANPSLTRLNSTQATSRFFNEDFVLLDPAQVVRVAGNYSSAADVIYKNGSCSDFKLPRTDWSNKQLNDLFQRIVRMRGNDKAATDSVWTDKALMNRIAAHASKFEDVKKKSLQQAFVRAVTANVPNLISFPGATNVFYTNPANISHVRLQDSALHIQYSEASPEGRGMRDTGYVSFASAADARAALKTLQRHLQ
ncbi:MAG: hypothetical protein KJ667_07125 [Alphaproteobacteria bacterium]|nr:hypothetical protein [Alphaproteobacteria bacterium]